MRFAEDVGLRSPYLKVHDILTDCDCFRGCGYPHSKVIDLLMDTTVVGIDSFVLKRSQYVDRSLVAGSRGSVFKIISSTFLVAKTF